MRGRDRTWRFWIFRSKLLSVKRRIATFLVSESLAVRVPGVVLEPRLLVRNTFERRTKARLDGASSSGAAAPVTPAALGPPPVVPRRLGYHRTIVRLSDYYFECFQQ
ncbi:hypothetical protein LINPERHAP1_LOCUS8097, partial [Linum perenne]